MSIQELLDFQIQEYIDSTFTREKATAQIYPAFELLYSFQVSDPESEYLELISRESYTDSTDLQDQFLLVLNGHLDTLLHAHSITLIETDNLYVKVEILSALHLLMYLEDYTHVLVTIESFADAGEKVAKILSEYCMLSEFDVLENIAEIGNEFLPQLKDYALSVETTIVDLDTSASEIINNVKLYTELHRDNIAVLLLKGDIAPGLTIKHYLSLLDTEFDLNYVKNIDTLASHIFSLLLLSKSGINGILFCYKKYSSDLLESQDTITRVEPKIVSLYSEFIEYKKQKESGYEKV